MLQYIKKRLVLFCLLFSFLSAIPLPINANRETYSVHNDTEQEIRLVIDKKFEDITQLLDPTEHDMTLVKDEVVHFPHNRKYRHKSIRIHYLDKVYVVFDRTVSSNTRINVSDIIQPENEYVMPSWSSIHPCTIPSCTIL